MIKKLTVFFAALILGLGIFLLIPNGYERVSWKLQEVKANLQLRLFPETAFVPTPVRLATVAPSALTPIPFSQTPGPTASTPASNPVHEPLSSPTAIPADFQLTGFSHIWQKINNCGPATLAMDLTYWGWKGTQANTAKALKPDPADRNVSPNEMAAYAQGVGLAAQVRVGGDITLLKHLIAAGYPVIVEKGIVLEDVGWEGHYVLLTGYADTTQNFTTQDSLQGPNFQLPYPLLADSWRAFNYTYLVIYPPTQEAKVLTMLGPDAELRANIVHAANLARQEIDTLSGQARSFAWFNLGTNLIALGDATNAANAYDQARQAELPSRIVWYQFGPYQAYFEAGRYDDLIALANATLSRVDNIEEIYYWRGQAYLAQGNQAGAQTDWQTALRYNHNYLMPRQALVNLGLAP